MNPVYNGSELIISNLKKRVRAAGFSYRELAQRLSLSEPTIKRLFTGKRITLDRVEAVGRALGISLKEILEDAVEPIQEKWRFTEAQEKLLSSDMRLYAFTFLVINQVPIQQIIKRFNIPRMRAEGYLLKLNRVGIIHLRGKFKYQVLIPSDVTWQPNGPIAKKIVLPSMRFFVDQVVRTGQENISDYFVCKMSSEVFFEYKSKFQALAKEFYLKAMRQEAVKAQSKNIGFLLAMAPLDVSVTKLLDSN